MKHDAGFYEGKALRALRDDGTTGVVEYQRAQVYATLAVAAALGGPKLDLGDYIQAPIQEPS